MQLTNIRGHNYQLGLTELYKSLQTTVAGFKKQDLPVLVRFNLEGKGCVVANGFADVIAAKVNLAEATNAWNQNET